MPRLDSLTVALAAVLAASPSNLLAQPGPPFAGVSGRWVQQWAGEVPAADRLEVRGRGRVVVRGASRTGIGYKLMTHGWARRGQRRVPVTFLKPGVVAEELPGGAVRLTLLDPECGACRVAMVLEVEVPRQLGELALFTSGGGASVRSIAGSVRARVAGGNLEIDDVGGAVTASTAGGDIRLGTIAGPVDCDTAGGSIELQRTAAAVLRTSAGSVRAAAVAGDLDVETGAGSIHVGRVRGRVRARTGGGAIRIAQAIKGVHAVADAGDIWIENATGSLVLTSGAGDIVAVLPNGARLLDSVLETSVGSVMILLPGSMALTVDASVRLARGRQGIVSDFPAIRMRRRGGHRGGSGEAAAAGAINGGGSLLRIRNGEGRIEIRKRQAARR